MKHKKTKIENALFILIALVVFALPLFSLATMNYTPMEQIPGSGTTSDWCTYVSYIYKFGLWAVGIAALLMIGIGGFMYTTSAGNNASMEKAKGVITDAIAGLLLALTSWLILNTINPDLLNCSLPATMQVSDVPISAAPAVGTGIQACLDCVPIPQGVLTCKDPASCTLSGNLVTKLMAVNSSVPWRITEAYPPTVPHRSSCHNNGTCADINLLGGANDPPSVKALSDALIAAGFTSFTYESGNCAPYTAVGVKCSVEPTMTASSFHVNS